MAGTPMARLAGDGDTLADPIGTGGVSYPSIGRALPTSMSFVVRVTGRKGFSVSEITLWQTPQKALLSARMRQVNEGR
jgi:hypothetical protein